MGVRHVFLAVLLCSAAFPCPAAAEGEREADALSRCAAEPSIPDNVVIDDEYLWSLATEMARRSPTFTRQLSKIGRLAKVTTTIRLTGRMRSAAWVAQSVISQAPGRLTADVQIPRALLFGYGYVELIAHELEHVIEQANGVNLRELARTRHSGVYRLDWGPGRPFETVRAQSAGRTVAREFHEHKRFAAH